MPINRARTPAQLIGAENHACRDDLDDKELVRAHLQSLRAMDEYRGVHIVLLVEANTPTAQTVSREFANYPNVSIASDEHREYGVWTSETMKRFYAFRFNEKLADRALCYHAHFVSANPFLPGTMSPAAKASATRKELERQLYAFQRIVLMPRALTGARRHIYSGKNDGEGHNSARRKDDLCMVCRAKRDEVTLPQALLMALYWSGEERNGKLRGTPNSKAAAANGTLRDASTRLLVDPLLERREDAALLAAATHGGTLAGHKRRRGDNDDA